MSFSQWTSSDINKPEDRVRRNYVFTFDEVRPTMPPPMKQVKQASEVYDTVMEAYNAFASGEISFERFNTKVFTTENTSFLEVTKPREPSYATVFCNRCRSSGHTEVQCGQRSGRSQHETDVEQYDLLRKQVSHYQFMMELSREKRKSCLMKRYSEYKDNYEYGVVLKTIQKGLDDKALQIKKKIEELEETRKVYTDDEEIKKASAIKVAQNSFWGRGILF
jgi:hypothetical protein